MRRARKPGSYLYLEDGRNGLTCRVDVFPLEARRQRNTGPEQSERTTRWFSLALAADAVNELQLKDLIHSFVLLCEPVAAKLRAAAADRGRLPRFGPNRCVDCRCRDNRGRAPVLIFAAPRACCAAVLAAFCAASPAAAHPHVWVTIKSEVLFDKTGKVTGIRHHWTFDDMYSAFVTTGIGISGKPATPEELLPVAKVNVESLAEFEYFTFAKDAHGKVEFAKPTDYSMTESDAMLATLHFTLPLATPASAGKVFSFQVYDPTFFVDFEFDKKSTPVALVDAPKGCSVNDFKPPPLTNADSQKLSLAAMEDFSPDTAFVIRLSDRAVVACP